MIHERIRIAIAEDESSVREALADLVSDEPTLELVGTAGDTEQAVELVRSTRPNVLLCDVKMPGGGGPRVATEIRLLSPETKILALSAYEDRTTVLEMLRAGAVGYLVKGVAPEEILDGVRNAARGKGQLSTNVASHVVEELTGVLDRSEELSRELERLERARDEMLQSLSHELLTPTTIIRGTGETLARHAKDLTAEDLESLTSGVARATGRLHRLVENVNLAAHLDDGTVSVDPRPAPIDDLLASLVSMDPDRVVLAVRDGPRPIALVDPPMARHALTAVVENALDLSEDAVEFDARIRDACVEVTVSDRGPGVAPELAERIFEPFLQADASTTRSHSGIGIGLYLTRRIAEAHAGSVRVEARSGGGSTFVLTFPAVAERQASA